MGVLKGNLLMPKYRQFSQVILETEKVSYGTWIRWFGMAGQDALPALVCKWYLEHFMFKFQVCGYQEGEDLLYNGISTFLRTPVASRDDHRSPVYSFPRLLSMYL